jgi:predicted AAA+ superfamily ATPase
MAHPFTQFFFWRTATGQEADLVFDRSGKKIVVEVKANSGTNSHDARKLETVLDDMGASEGWIVGHGGESTQLSARVRSVSLDQNPSWLP